MVAQAVCTAVNEEAFHVGSHNYPDREATISLRAAGYFRWSRLRNCQIGKGGACDRALTGEGALPQSSQYAKPTPVSQEGIFWLTSG